MKFLACALLAATLLGPSLSSAETGESAEAPKTVTQAELAKILVNITGLHRFAAPNATDPELFELLSRNGISPVDGWKAGEVVTKGVLARVVVQAMKLEDQIEDKEDPNAYVELLKSLGIPIDSVGQAIAQVESLPNPDAISPDFGGTTDPLLTPRRIPEPDSLHGGALMLDPNSFAVTVAEIRQIIAASLAVSTPQPPPPVTPN